MTNSELFFTKAYGFQNRRAEITSEYEARMEAIATAKGSEFYQTESEKAVKKRDQALKDLKKEYADSINITLEAMQKTNNKRGIAAPTEEELRITQALKLRDSVTVEELDRVANALSHSEICLAVVQEIAHANGIFGHNYLARLDSGEMPVQTVNAHIKALAKATQDFLEHDTRRSARLAANYHAAHYGNFENEPPLAKRKMFETKESCYLEFLGIGGKDLKSFCNAVDE
ncbi:MAG: hypothetical protein VZR27_10675 [Acutalibacteraceae bacterium]|nr:hypothetical protein [Acutalibacteraceae bacterium]